MEKIDVIILTNNEEDVIEDCLKSVKGWAENIFVIDAGSTDKTVEIAKKNGAQVFEHDFKDFAHQRNFAFTKVKSSWIFYLDADERVTTEFKKEVEDKINSGEKSGFEVKRKTYYFGKNWGLEDKVARIFRVDNFIEWRGVVHETAYINGEMGLIQSPIEHFTHRNLEQMLAKTNNWSKLEAKLRFATNHPPMRGWRFIRVMMSEFIRSYFKEKGYKNGTYGLIEAIYQSYSMFITYAKLWEMQNTKN